MIYYFLACLALIVACACFVGIVFTSVRTTARAEVRGQQRRGRRAGRNPGARALRSDE